MESDRALAYAPTLGFGRDWLKIVASRPVIGAGYAISGILAAVAVGLGSSPSLSGPLGPASPLVMTLLWVNLGLLASLGALISWRVTRLMAEQTADAGARLHLRFVALFAAAAALPALIMALFFGVLVTRGVESWFNARVQTVVENSAKVARSYLEEQAIYNRDLRSLVREGLFREDLYFRLNVAPVRLPPLRDRTEDIPDLARTFLLRAHREGLPAKTIDAGALDRLKAHGWPGNVRELENLIRRICALYAEEMITARIIERELSEQSVSPVESAGPITLSALVERHLAAYFADQPEGVPPGGLYDRVLEDVERPLIQLTLAATRGNQVRAAEVLGLNRNTLRKKIQELGLAASRARR